jgi:hypothetical protein
VAAVSISRPQKAGVWPLITLRRPLVLRIGTGGHWLPALDDYGKLYHAGRRGLTVAHNPYPEATHQGIAWVIGFAHGRKKRPQVVGGSPRLKS